jgi:hypothetical protein
VGSSEYEGCSVGVWVGFGEKVEVAGEEFEGAGAEEFIKIGVSMGATNGNEESMDGVGERVGEGFLSCLSPGGNDSVITPDQRITKARMTQAINFMLNRMLFPKKL